MSNRTIRTDFKHLVFNDIYTRLESPKAKRRAYSYMEAAIQCLARKGFDETTLDNIAREAGVTRPGLRRYFSDADEIKLLALKYIRVLFQKMTVDSAARHTEASVMLSAYVQACFQWTKSSRTHAVVWVSFMQRCPRQPKFRKMNSDAVKAGTDRITTLLEQGKSEGRFQCEDCIHRARMIQVLLTGGIISVLSENIENAEEFSRAIEKECIRMAREP